MIRDGVCPECGSRAIIPQVRVIGKRRGVGDHELELAMLRPAVLGLWQGELRSRLRAWVCGECGYAALFADRPGELLATYRQHLAAAGGRESGEGAT